MKIFNFVSTLLVIIALAGCDGNARPFEEAVEVRTENLTSIAVVPPAISVSELVMNIDDTAQFGVQGTTIIGQQITLSGSDRNWQVTDESVASINDDGQLVAIANGDVGVFISIGGLVSETYDLRVSDATLTDVQEIGGESIIERCLPEDYQATGLYDDGTVRDLAGVNWTLAAADAGNARLQNNPDTTVTVTGINSAAVTLTAALSGFNLSLPIEISNSLISLSISPRSANIDVEDEVSFAAFGEFEGTTPGATSDTGSRSDVNVTEAVDWQLAASGVSIASVSNDGDSRGRLTGLSSGEAVLTASCGNKRSGPVSVIVSDSASSSDELSFAQGDSTQLVVGGSSVLLRVSTGSIFNSINELDQNDLTWVLSVDDTSVPAISLQDEDSGTNAGRITALSAGGATITVTDDDGASGSIRVEVTSN